MHEPCKDGHDWRLDGVCVVCGRDIAVARWVEDP